MFRYYMQYPNINCSNFSGRRIPPSSASKQINTVNTAPLRQDGGEYTPGAYDVTPAIRGVWVSLLLNSKVTDNTGVALPDYKTLYPSELILQDKIVASHRNSLYAVIEDLNLLDPSVHMYLSCVHKWDMFSVALAEGYTVMVGGTVYASFILAGKTGIVPMPQKNEGLLGGHLVNVVSYDPDTDMASAIGNLGKNFGNHGYVYVRGSYLRNLGISRDFFVLRVRNRDHAATN